MDKLRRKVGSLRSPRAPATAASVAGPASSTAARSGGATGEPSSGSSSEWTDSPSAASAARSPATLRPPDRVPALPAPAHAHKNRHPPVHGDFDGAHICAGGGVAIFHVATARVVLCYHARHALWFLPKGRRDVGESAVRGAEREGFEESGYRNRILPIPAVHLQPTPATTTFAVQAGALGAGGGGDGRSEAGVAALADPKSYARAAPAVGRLAAEPVLTQLMPVTRSRQYLLHWYIAETLPPAVEAALDEATAALARVHGLDPRRVYVQPPPWPEGLGIRARVAMDVLPDAAGGRGPEREEGAVETSIVGGDESGSGGAGGSIDDSGHSGLDNSGGPGPETDAKGRAVLLKPGGAVYEPVRHEGTGVDEEEAEYESYLVPIEEAVQLLEYGMDWVVRWGWDAISQLWELDGRDAEHAAPL